MTTALPVSEAEWANTVHELAVTLGWLRYHTHDSRRSPSGFPDEVFVRDRLVVAELKRDGKKPTPKQQAWLDAFQAAGIEAYCWTPADFDQVVDVLKRRAA